MGDTNQHIEADLVHVQPRQEPEPEAGSGPEPEPEPAPPPTSAAEMLRRRRTLRTEQGSLPGDTAANLRLYARDTPLTPEPPPPAPAPAPGPTVPSNGDEALITDEELERVIASLDRMLAGDEAEQQKTPWEGPPLFGSYCLNKKFRVDGVEDPNGNLTTVMQCTLPYPAEAFNRIMTDIPLQCTFDEYIKSKQVIGEVDGNEVVHFEMKMPAPLSNRDWMFYRRRFEDKEKGTYYWCHRDIRQDIAVRDWVGPVKGVVRAGGGDFWTYAVIKELTPTSCQAVIKSQDNYNGAIPKWVINWATKKGVPGWFKGVEKATMQLMIDEGQKTEEDMKAWKKNYKNTV